MTSKDYGPMSPPAPEQPDDAVELGELTGDGREATATFQKLLEIGHTTRGRNIGENSFTVYLDPVAELVCLDDGQIRCWGADGELADAIADLDADADFEDVWAALDNFPNNA